MINEGLDWTDVYELCRTLNVNDRFVAIVAGTFLRVPGFVRFSEKFTNERMCMRIPLESKTLSLHEINKIMLPL